MKTEYYELDKLVNVDKPQLILLGARPGMGKSTLALNIGTNIALHQNIPVLFFSLEENYLNPNMKELNYDELMKPSDDLPFNCIADKIISAIEMIRKDYFKKIRKPYSYIEDNLEIDEKEFKQKVDLSINKIKNSKFFIEDEAPITIDEIILKIEEYVKNVGTKFVIIDYLQLVQYEKSKLMSRDNETADIIKKLKEISKKLKITILVTSQISHDPDYRTNHRPILSDLRESEHILKIIDTIMFLYRDEYYNYDTEMKNVAELYVAKNNNGYTGTIDLIYLSEYFKFANLEKSYAKDNNIVTCRIKEDIVKKQIKEIYESNKNKFFIEPHMMNVNEVIDLIYLYFFKKKNIKCKICQGIEDNIINNMLNNNIEEFLNTLKDSECVIFTFSYFEINENLQNYIYDTSKKVLDNGTTKKIIYISETLGLSGFSKRIYEELNKSYYILRK